MKKNKSSRTFGAVGNLVNLRDPVLITIHIYIAKYGLGLGEGAEKLFSTRYKITTKIRRLEGSNVSSLQPPWPTTAAATPKG